MNTAQRTISVERKSDRRPFKPKPWSHQDDLRKLVGQRILLVFMDGEIYGRLLAADQFTLKVCVENKQQSVVTYFKSALAGFGAA